MSKQPRVIINAGHFNTDPGCRFGDYTERDLVKKIRDEVLNLLPNAIPVPDEFNLRQSIDWVNSFCSKDDLCIEIHLNANANSSLNGCEAYYHDNPYLAEMFSRHVSKALGVTNRGTKHDSMTYVGSLGWLRQIKGQSVLVEACYLTNYQDRMKIIMPSGQEKVAQGIVNAVTEHINNFTLLGRLKEMVKKLLELINK
jgi:N-acetylmuramoyl-L-alanine amidase